MVTAETDEGRLNGVLRTLSVAPVADAAGQYLRAMDTAASILQGASSADDRDSHLNLRRQYLDDQP